MIGALTALCLFTWIMYLGFHAGWMYACYAHDKEVEREGRCRWNVTRDEETKT